MSITRDDYDIGRLEAMVPEHLRNGLRLYIEQGVKPGSFLMGVLENDLRNAIFKGDTDSLAGLRPLVLFLHNYAPGECHGNPTRVANWMISRGLRGVA